MYKTFLQNGPSLKGPSLNDLTHHYVIPSLYYEQQYDTSKEAEEENNNL